MKKILFSLLFLFISISFSQFDGSISGWSKGAFYVPNGIVYSEGLIVVDEGTLAAESLNEVDFATTVKWTEVGDFTEDPGVAFDYSHNGGTGSLTQAQADLAIAGVDAVWYKFTYTITSELSFSAEMTITTGFASSAVSLKVVNGTHTVYFKSKTTPVDFVLSVTSTLGDFTIDDVTLKEIQGGDVDISGKLLIRGVDIGAGIGASTDDQTIDVFSISGDNVQLSLEDDGEATKTVDISTTTAVVANTAKVTTQWTTNVSDIYYSIGKVGVGTPTPNAPFEAKGASPGVVGGFQSGHLHVTGSSAVQYANAVITGHSAYNTNTQLWYLGSTSTSNNDVGFHNRLNGSVHFNTNNTRKMEITADGNMSIGESIDDVQPIFSIIGDADSDPGDDVSETFAVTIVPNANPLLAYIGFTLGQGLGYGFDKQIDVTGNIVVSGTVDGIDIATDVAANTAKTGVTTEISNVVEDTSPELGADLDILTFEIKMDSEPDANVTASGTKAIFTNGNAGNVAFGDICYIVVDGDVEFADASVSTTMPGLVMALETIATTVSGEFLLQGFVRNDSWTWTVGGLIYVSLTGTTTNTLTQTAPSVVGEQVQVVGVATHANRIFFNPNLMLIEI